MHLMDPSVLITGILSDRQEQRPSRHIVSNSICSHCSLKKQSSFTFLTAIGEKKNQMASLKSSKFKTLHYPLSFTTGILQFVVGKPIRIIH